MHNCFVALVLTVFVMKKRVKISIKTFKQIFLLEFMIQRSLKNGKETTSLSILVYYLKKISKFECQKKILNESGHEDKFRTF